MRAFLVGLDTSSEESLKRALRCLRQSVMLRLIARDLNGLANLGEVIESCTQLAEVAVAEALCRLDGWQREIHGSPLAENGVPQQLIVIGMGKLGGRELNVSSDIDLIFAYAEDGETNGARRLSNHEYFVRLAKKLISTIGDITVDGFVFRVDMRLRPYGDSGPLVGSFSMLEEYYQNQGREWERYAWIKGRVIAGPEQELQDLLRPFVFRKYLDYGAIASMRELKQQIMREVNRREMQDNIKLGPGGIREIEFIAQVFQLIRGGQDITLQIRPTLQVLARVAERGSLEVETVIELSTAYVFLRNLEHRLQYLQDAQTQMLPTDIENRQRIALGMGFADWADFFAALQLHRDHVSHHFAAVFSTREPLPDNALTEVWLGGMPDIEVERCLTRDGYTDALEVRQRLQSLRMSGRYRQLPSDSRKRFDALLPAVLTLSGRQAKASETLTRMLTLLEAICRRASYLALLAEYPQALELVIRLVSASPWLASYLAQQPILLDELLDTRQLYSVPNFDALRTELHRRLLEVEGDIERQMDVMRHFKHAQVFRLAAQDLIGALPLEKLSDHLSALADLILDQVLNTLWPLVRGKHRDSPRFAVIGYGKLGGRELGYASDLDLIFLYDDEAPQAGEIYARFGQRINTWLDSSTSAGQLYEVDLRLRPDGASGLLVSSVAAFAEYQQDKAWTWEHQALSRARFCAGEAAIGNAFERIRLDILGLPRDGTKLRAEILAMRQKMRDGHHNPGEMFDLKHDQGGIVDVEFIVQYLVLAHASQYPSLMANVGNIALLREAAILGLVPADLAQSVIDAYRLYRSEQHMLRLQGVGRARVAPEAFSGSRAFVTGLWRTVFAR